MIKRVGFTILTAMLFCLSIDLGVIPAAAQEIKRETDRKMKELDKED